MRTAMKTLVYWLFMLCLTSFSAPSAFADSAKQVEDETATKAIATAEGGEQTAEGGEQAESEPATPEAEAPAKKHILLLGDSLSSAYNIKQSEGWVNLLSEKIQQEYPDFTIINAATSGDTTQNALQQIKAKLAEFEPEIVIIEIGGNDGLRGFPIPTIKRNVEKLIKVSQEQAKVLLVGIQIPPNYGRLYTEQFKQLYFDLAKKYKVSFLPFLLEGVALVPGFMQNDGIHPTAEAQPQVMANAWEYLEPLLKTAAASSE